MGPPLVIEKGKAGQHLPCWNFAVSVKRRDKASERFDQRRQVVLNGVPDYGGAKIPIGVDGEVPEVDHLPPGDFRMAVCYFRRDVVRGFADDSQVVNDGVHDLFVVFKRLEINAGDIALDFVD